MGQHDEEEVQDEAAQPVQTGNSISCIQEHDLTSIRIRERARDRPTAAIGKAYMRIAKVLGTWTTSCTTYTLTRPVIIYLYPHAHHISCPPPISPVRPLCTRALPNLLVSYYYYYYRDVNYPHHRQLELSAHQLLRGRKDISGFLSFTPELITRPVWDGGMCCEVSNQTREEWRRET